MEVVACSTDSPDIAILRRADDIKFGGDCPVLMPTSELPWNKNPQGWGGRAYVFHVPLEVIDHAANSEAGSPDVCGDVEEATLHMPSRHHFRLRAFERGSSGGAVISPDGRLMGVLAKTQTYGTLTLEDVRTSGFRDLAEELEPHAAPKTQRGGLGAAAMEARDDKGSYSTAASMKDDSLDVDIPLPDEKERDRDADLWSISAASTTIPEKGTTAVIPSAVNLHFRGSSVPVPLSAFLAEGQLHAKVGGVELGLAEKAGGTDK